VGAGPRAARLPALVDPALLDTRRWRTTPFAAINLHATARGLALYYDDLLREDGRVAGLLGPDLFAELLAPLWVGRPLFRPPRVPETAPGVFTWHTPR
jgi:hypothetical protein